MGGNNVEVGVAIIGGGQGCLELLQLFDQFRLEEFRARVLGVADPHENAPGIVYARAQGLLTTRDFTEFYSHPEIELIIELYGDNQVLEKIYSTKPPHIKVIDHVGARLFWDLMKLKAEKRARNILESTRDAFIVVNPSGMLMHYNQAAERMLGSQCRYTLGKAVNGLVENIFGKEGLEMLGQKAKTVYNLTANQGTEAEFPAEGIVIQG